MITNNLKLFIVTPSENKFKTNIIHNIIVKQLIAFTINITRGTQETKFLLAFLSFIINNSKTITVKTLFFF